MLSPYEQRRLRTRMLRSVFNSIKAQLFHELTFERGPKCALCRRARACVLDHILPLSGGGTNGRHNLQPSCKRCNELKGSSVTWHNKIV